MIKTIIFDFGDVFINLDKEGAIETTKATLNLQEFPEEMLSVNCLYEQGLISTEEFKDFYFQNFKNISEETLKDTWNYILKDFPEHKLDFLKQLAKDGNYLLILLSNTNELHIDWVKENISVFEDFKKQFDKFYLSHEIQLRKPDTEIYEFVLRENNLKPEECLFVDDLKENTDAAKSLGIHVWNIDPKTEDVCTLFATHKHLF
ncbi:HAD family phosphatase [Mangrovimonas sp. DI 80]|uniref:HAD family hydrolase n=1 Tax=Mangrovimonas sp. DI 80 TaxID=1779330 RepID=UPI00097608C6|nr:HAD family phosphatase [Mangrovimonas sp. DI 80]OMP29798.1 haloacid dehalogenase [Mangrovimonas sp. DI 80]